MLSKQIIEVAQKIGKLYNYDRDKLERLAITKLEIKEEKLWITTGRPGVLIGPRGKHIERLSDAVGMRIHIIEDENYILDWMCYNPENERY